jgi:hypothetical protein
MVEFLILRNNSENHECDCENNLALAGQYRPGEFGHCFRRQFREFRVRKNFLNGIRRRGGEKHGLEFEKDIQ